MATISIPEGKTGTIIPADTLWYPEINSCLTITTVFSTAKRNGGHVVMFPEGTQLNLQQICDFINKEKGDSIYILGDIGTWDDNWAALPALTINGVKVKNVSGIAAAMGYTTAKTILFDIYNWTQKSATYDIYFGFESTKRALWAIDKATQKKYTVPNHPAW
jgi:hypothetical protein